MRKALPIVSVLCAVAFLFGETAAPQKKKTTVSKTASKSKNIASRKSAPAQTAPRKTASTKTASGRTASAKTASGKTGSSQTASRRTAASRKTARKPAPLAWRPTQRVPTPERYKEIQAALASKGYLEGKSETGVWDDSSVSALKKFQQDQNLDPSGKLDSLSLIALGLGPRRDKMPSPAERPSSMPPPHDSPAPVSPPESQPSAEARP